MVTIQASFANAAEIFNSLPQGEHTGRVGAELGDARSYSVTAMTSLPPGLNTRWSRSHGRQAGACWAASWALRGLALTGSGCTLSPRMAQIIVEVVTVQGRDDRVGDAGDVEPIGQCGSRLRAGIAGVGEDGHAIDAFRPLPATQPRRERLPALGLAADDADGLLLCRYCMSLNPIIFMP